MRPTKHLDARMNQRGISKHVVDLVLSYGRCDQDKYVLDRQEVDRRLELLNRERALLLKVRDKGGVVVIAEGSALVTAYNRH